MGGDPERVARELFAGGFEDWPGDALALLAEDVVINASSGELYVGHEGFAHWCEEEVRERRDSVYRPGGAEVVREHWVLMHGAAESADPSGTRQLQPGFWLVRVRDELIAAILYFQTEAAARNALSEQ